jgi:hypothetical protein
MANASKSSPAPKPAEAKAFHLTASMRVIRAHQRRPALTVQDAHETVKELAPRLGTGAATLEDQALEEKLKKATGLSVAELARFAEE